MEQNGPFGDEGVEPIPNPPSLHDLLYVQSIAKTEAVSKVRFTLFSLEAYADGFGINARLAVEAGHHAFEETHRVGDLHLHPAESEIELARLFKSQAAGSNDASARWAAPLLHPRPHVSAVDNTGQTYRAWRIRGSGSATQRRYFYAFTPAIGPLATQVNITIHSVSWDLLHKAGVNEPSLRVDEGPWTFPVNIAQFQTERT